jgi:type IV secretory pathway VirB9-like protein
MNVTWKPARLRPHEKRSQLPSTAFAFPAERKEPLTDANHVRSAIARFAQVDGVDDAERAQAFGNIKAAAQYYGIALRAKNWRDLTTQRDGKASG